MKNILDILLGKNKAQPTRAELAAHVHYYFLCNNRDADTVTIYEVVNGYRYTITRSVIRDKAQS